MVEKVSEKVAPIPAVAGRIHSVDTFSAVDGPGLRMVVFEQVCGSSQGSQVVSFVSCDRAACMLQGDNQPDWFPPVVLGLTWGTAVLLSHSLQGCAMRCAFCSNPDTWTPCGGDSITSKDIASQLRRCVSSPARTSNCCGLSWLRAVGKESCWHSSPSD
jgi:hypothetical protein